MDTLFILAGLLGLGDLVLLLIWAHERGKRRTAERHANEAIREKYRLLDALERKAAKARGPVVVPIGAKARDIRDAIAELTARQAAETRGGA